MPFLSGCNYNSVLLQYLELIQVRCDTVPFQRVLFHAVQRISFSAQVGSTAAEVLPLQCCVVGSIPTSFSFACPPSGLRTLGGIQTTFSWPGPPTFSRPLLAVGGRHVPRGSPFVRGTPPGSRLAGCGQFREASRICTYERYGKLLIASIRAYTYNIRVYVQYTDNILHRIYVKIPTIYLALRAGFKEPVPKHQFSPCTYARIRSIFTYLCQKYVLWILNTY